MHRFPNPWLVRPGLLLLALSSAQPALAHPGVHAMGLADRLLHEAVYGVGLLVITGAVFAVAAVLARLAARRRLARR